MLNQDEWTWPSTDCNGIPLIDPVTVSFQGTLVLFARQSGVPVTQLYTNVRVAGAMAGSQAEWAGWTPLPMVEPSQASTSDQSSADPLPLLRLGGMDLLTVDEVATTPSPADAPFRVVTDGRTISCFRQSTAGTLYVDRFILVQVPGGGAGNSSGTPGWELRRVWEVRYRRSELRDVPNGRRDTLDSRSLLGEPFLEPTVELTAVSGIQGGAFDVALTPTSDAEGKRWHIVAVTGTSLTFLSYPQDASGRIDLTPATAKSFTISPAALVQGAGNASLTPYAGVAVTSYQEQEATTAADGTTSRLRRTARLMVTAAVRNVAAGLSAALAAWDFTILPDGTVPAYPTDAACTPVDGVLTAGHFAPANGTPDYPVPDSAILSTGAGTIASVLLGQPQPTASPALFDGADGLVHLYFAGPLSAGGGPGPFLVAQHDPVVTRVRAAVPWALSGTTGTFSLVGLRPGTSLNGLAVAVADCQGQPDLCTLTVGYGAPSGLPGETWNGVPRDIATMISILDGQSAEDPGNPSVISGALAYYDLEGKRAMARLPLTGGDAGAKVTLVSHRPDVPLATAAAAAPSGGTTTLTLGFSLPGGHTATQTWAAVPTDTVYLAPVLAGTAANYPYTTSDTPVYGLATDAGSILLFAASAQAVTISIGAATDGDPTHCDVSVGTGGNPTLLPNVGRAQADLVTALQASGPVTGLFPYISPDPMAGSAVNQSVTEAMDLRDLSLLFDLVAPPAGDVAAASVQAAVLQGRRFTSLPPADAPVGRGLLALAAIAPSVPLLGGRPSVTNGTCSITEKGTNGQWLVAPVPQALSFGEQNAMVVKQPGNFTAPTRSWTIEAWAQPTDGTPSRVLAYNGGTTPPLAGVSPSYFMGTVGQPALRFPSFTPGAPYAGSYVNVTAHSEFGPSGGQGFTWEAWIKPDPAPCPAGGANLLGCVLQAQDTTIPGKAQWQLGLDNGRHLTFGLRTGPAGTPSISYLVAPSPLEASTWTHVAVTGSLTGNTWTFTLYVGAAAVQTVTNLVPYQTTIAPYLCIGAHDLQNVTMFGSIAEVRFWQFAATPAELQRTLYASLTGHEPGLLGYWPLTEDPSGRTFANRAVATGAALNGSLNSQSAQPAASSTDGNFVSLVAGVGGAQALLARAFLPANHWNHLAAVYQAAGALSLNPSGVGAARADYGTVANPTGLVLGQAATLEAWVQMATPTHLSQTILSQWGVLPADQAFQFGIDATGKPYCTVQLTTGGSGALTTVTGSGAVSVIDGQPHHLAASYAVTVSSGNGGSISVCTVTLYVDGQAQTPVSSPSVSGTLQANNSTAPFAVGISALSSTATGPVAISAQAPFVGVLTGLRFWSETLTQAQVQAAMNAKRSADGDSGVVSAWWFDEQIGMNAADDAAGNDLSLSDTDMWAAFASISTLDLYGNGVPLGLIVSAPADTTGGYLTGDTQLTIGAYTAGGTVKDGFSGQLAELRLWSTARSNAQLIDTMYRPLTGDETGLNAYWTLNGNAVDQTGRGANGTPTGSPAPGYATSQAPVANEGPQVRNAYNGQQTDFQVPLSGRAAAIEYAETETEVDGSPYGVLRRAYFFANPVLATATGYGLGEVALTYVGQVQTNPTLIGYIEGAPPVPSENLSRPLYSSIIGFNAYADSTTVALTQAETKALTFTSSDYSTSLQMNLETKLGLKIDTETSLFTGFLSFLNWKYKVKLGVKSKVSLTQAAQQDESYASSWTETLTDTLGLRGMWEAPQPQDYVNKLVGRRYQPFNYGYALVESLTADVYALQLHSNGAMVGRIVVPNLSIPPDRNVLTFKIDPAYVKNGTLDGKIGLVNDPDYPTADVQRGSYFKPEDAYARAAAIDRSEAQLRAYYDQFDSESLGKSGNTPDLSGAAAKQFYDYNAGVPGQGIVNRYVWTALSGLHAETEQFSAVHVKTFTGLYGRSYGVGPSGEFETGSMLGVYGGLDLLFGGEIKIQIGKSESQTDAVSLTVTAVGDPVLQGYDAQSGAYTTGYCPGKVDAYRFMTFYLPPAAQNATDFTSTVVDPQWLQFSSDPNAIALRAAQTEDNGVWRILHRVTYVSRVPPRFDTNPDQTIAPEPPQPIDVQDNPVLISLVQQALGHNPPTAGNIGAAVAAVLAPTDGTSAALLSRTVPWWAAFLAATRGGSPNQQAVTLMDQLLTRTVGYIQAGYASGVLKPPA
jgi:large repetitive protein